MALYRSHGYTLRANRNLNIQAFDFHLHEYDRENRKLMVATEVHVIEHDTGQVHEPLFHLQYDQAQILMDDLWASGVRPAEISHRDGQLQSMDKHLQDMRQIAFAILEINKPNE